MFVKAAKLQTQTYTSHNAFLWRMAVCTVCSKTKIETIVNIELTDYDENDPAFTPYETYDFVSYNVIQLYGNLYDDMVYETFELTNELRKSLGLNELNWYEKLADISKIRLAEAMISYSYIRLNGISIICLFCGYRNRVRRKYFRMGRKCFRCF